MFAVRSELLTLYVFVKLNNCFCSTNFPLRRFFVRCFYSTTVFVQLISLYDLFVCCFYCTIFPTYVCLYIIVIFQLKTLFYLFFFRLLIIDLRRAKAILVGNIIFFKTKLSILTKCRFSIVDCTSDQN